MNERKYAKLGLVVDLSPGAIQCAIECGYPEPTGPIQLIEPFMRDPCYLECLKKGGVPTLESIITEIPLEKMIVASTTVPAPTSPLVVTTPAPVAPELLSIAPTEEASKSNLLKYVLLLAGLMIGMVAVKRRGS